VLTFAQGDVSFALVRRSGRATSRSPPITPTTCARPWRRSTPAPPRCS
jgi:hypothetical protein